MSRYYTKSGCIWLFVSLYFTQYINLIDTAIQLQTCSGRFPSLLSALSLALVIVTERLRALRLLTLEQVSLLLPFTPIPLDAPCSLQQPCLNRTSSICGSKTLSPSIFISAHFGSLVRFFLYCVSLQDLAPVFADGFDQHALRMVSLYMRSSPRRGSAFKGLT